MKTKLLNDIFDTWQIDEAIIPSISFDTILKQDRNFFFDKKRIEDLRYRLKPFPKSFKQLQYYAKNSTSITQYLLKNGKQIKHDLLKPLQSNLFTSQTINIEEKKHLSLDKIINKYNSFAQLLCPSPKRNQQNIFLQILSNTLFFHVFSSNYTTFKKYLHNDQYFPLVRFIYSIIWKNLSSKGWSIWHAKTLKDLKKLSDDGKEIHYFAGGTDIIQLIQQGIYSIHVIDPFIPQQKKFYSSGWRFLIQGSVGDQILWPEENLSLKRDFIRQDGFFTVGPHRLQKIKTTWLVFKNKEKKPRGTITFDRRTIQQYDFDYKDNIIPLLSFNELYFIASHNKPWGIDIKKISSQKHLYIKQLEKPLSKKILGNIYSADKYDDDLEFIQFGSNVD